MSGRNFIKYLINEDIYVIDDDLELSKDKEPLEPANEEVEVLSYKSIVAIVSDNSSEKINEKDKQYLSKILSAVSVDMTNISLINIENETIEDLGRVEKIIDFTPNHSIAPNVVPYDLSKFNNAQLIVANPLGQIAESVELRKKLWGALKLMFN